MIVKNEAHVIERALRSALRFMDTWCIVDTGSTDDTMSIIRRVAKDLGKPGVLYERPWVNFGHNRTEALRLARDQMNWIWMLDADDTIDGTPIAVADLSSDESGYTVEIHHGGMKQERPHLFNAKFAWSYVGAVHEYAHCPAKSATKRLPSTIWITARTEGSRSQDGKKYERDAQLLEDELASGTADVGRSLFYLAQSYRDSGNIPKAKEVYQRRIDHGGWVQETYICYLNLIRLTNDFSEKLALAWKAQSLIPTRREAVYEVLVPARRDGHFTQEVYALGVAFRDVPLNTANLFSDTHCYGWSYDDELAVIAYYTQHSRQSMDSALRAIQACPETQKPRIQENIRFAKERLKNESVNS
jgi:glycosyltransferase involved in cell wall biosynthesis